jgi:PAS domain S-box-containing protein
VNLMMEAMETRDLQRELAALRQSLEEAEELRRAISGGEVDAFVVGPGDEQKRVLLLSGSYARYRQIVEDMRQGAVTLTKAGDILFANHSFAEMVGEPLIDLFRSPFERYLQISERGRFAALLAARPGQPDVDLTLRRRDGGTTRVRLSLVSGGEDFVTLIATDRSGEQPLEEAGETLEAIRRGEVDAFVIGGEAVVMLSEAQRTYQVLAERMRQGVAAVSADGQICYVNERFVSMMATPAARLLGISLLDLVAAPDREKLAQMLEAPSRSAQCEVRLRCGNGERMTVSASAAAVADGQTVYLFSDLTEQKRHEASDERTRRFLAMLAHEFGNMLAPISTSAELLKRVDGLDADARRALETIERQVDRLAGLVDDLRCVNPRE